MKFELKKKLSYQSKWGILRKGFICILQNLFLYVQKSSIHPTCAIFRKTSILNLSGRNHHRNIEFFLLFHLKRHRKFIKLLPITYLQRMPSRHPTKYLEYLNYNCLIYFFRTLSTRKHVASQRHNSVGFVSFQRVPSITDHRSAAISTGSRSSLPLWANSCVRPLMDNIRCGLWDRKPAVMTRFYLSIINLLGWCCTDV